MTEALENHHKDPAANQPERGGYGNPPKHTRFSDSQQPPRKARRKREPTYAELFRKELDKRIWIQENGKRIRITKRRAWIKGVVNRMLQHDPHAENTFLLIERPGDASPGGLTLYIIG
jgi:hypothetical protein